MIVITKNQGKRCPTSIYVWFHNSWGWSFICMVSTPCGPEIHPPTCGLGYPGGHPIIYWKSLYGFRIFRRCSTPKSGVPLPDTHTNSVFRKLCKYIHPWKLTCPPKKDYFSREYIFQPLIFRGHVSFQGCNQKKETAPKLFSTIITLFIWAVNKKTFWFFCCISTGWTSYIINPVKRNMNQKNTPPKKTTTVKVQKKRRFFFFSLGSLDFSAFRHRFCS